MRELKQLDTGSTSMLNNVQLEVDVVLSGGASLMEHPAPPLQEEHASIWRTSLQQRFCFDQPGCQRIQFQQWKFGSEAVKPTAFRVLGLPPVAKHFHAHALDGALRPSTHLAGLNPDSGGFKTAQAKEYRAHLCMAMVDTLLAGLSRRHQQYGFAANSFSQLGEREIFWLETVCAASATCHRATFLPDYQHV